MPAAATHHKLPTIQIEDVEWYLDGDVLLHEKQLDAYQATTTPSDKATPDELLAATKDGKVVRWNPGATLRYAVVKSTFPDAMKYAEVVTAIEAATRDWQDACWISFEHVAELDTSPDPSAQTTFVVRHVDAKGQFFAAAFFPSDRGSKRQVVIDPSFFMQQVFSTVGILRHELGHVLGFRHEHIRNAAAAALLGVESTEDTYDLTAYDSRSVMHYVNQQFGNAKLDIDPLDKLGAQRVYGLPAAQAMLTD